ncbi:Stomatin-like protein 2, mitochondrial [Rhizophlyctis rosea]|uniref:Stomatin-like protein 2, mitochondrial n=1 Tax=Rhizophlyctis rosea TaxID=64517 RepID=A0AAD5SN80_9FUNG|nr:Stomatin-like protein 2, mitochondrial [Rhizophlyctis rosea]
MASRALTSALHRVASRRALANLQVRSLAPISRASHGLVVPYAHMPITDFQNGIPVDQVRHLEEREQSWDFWTTSEAFSNWKPGAMGVTFVPPGEIWVVGKRDGTVSKAIPEGTGWTTPLLETVLAVKSAHPVVQGIVPQGVTTKDGQKVDGYIVTYHKVIDAAASAAYVDPETNRQDSERAAANLVKKTFRREIGSLTLENNDLSASDKQALSEKILAALKKKADEYGLEPISVEIRGAFPVSEKVPARLRAMDPPPPAEDAFGHGLSADYWADVLTPPFFEKKTFGSAKYVRTPATVSLEWVVPSPPDFHHFNELPRMIAQRPEQGGKEVAKAKH